MHRKKISVILMLMIGFTTSYAIEPNFNYIFSNKKSLAITYGQINYLSESCNIPYFDILPAVNDEDSS